MNGRSNRGGSGRPGWAFVGWPLSVAALGLGLGLPWAASGENNQAQAFAAGTNVQADLVIGDSGTNNTLDISGGTVSCPQGAIGNGAAAAFNQAWVRGPTSQWANAGTLTIGSQGDLNGLVVTNGASVTNAIGDVGAFTSASSNSVAVTGSNSLWSSGYWLFVGHDGSGNRLALDAGGRVSAVDVTIGDSASAMGNSAIVTGGATLNGSDALIIGRCGTGGMLLVTNSGQASGSFGFIGCESSAAGNTAQVAGVGSVWTVASNLVVGADGNANTLVVSAGGVAASTAGMVGDYDLADSNLVVVTGLGSTWSNSGPLVVGNDGSFNQVVVTNGGLMASAAGMIGVYALASNNAVIVVGSNSVWSVGGYLYIGNNGDGNTLVVTNGGWVGNSSGRIGENGRNNQAVISGSGSVWSNINDLIIGDSGSGNAMTILNGGKVYDSYTAIGTSTGSSNNSVLVAGTGAVWYAGSDLKVGSQGIGSSLVVSNGGMVRSGSGRMGRYVGSNGNRATVTGNGSLWTNTDIVVVGVQGAGNSLTISNGGQVAGDSTGTVGDSIGSDSNSIAISGTGSVLRSASGFTLGHTGSWNTVTVSSGGILRAPSVAIGSGVGSSNNLLTVSGGSLQVTNTSRTGLLDIQGGAVIVQSGVLSADRVNIGSSGSMTFSNGLDLHGTLSITNAGLIVAGDGSLFPSNVTLAGNGLLRGPTNGTLYFTGNFTSGSTNAAQDLLHLNVAFTNSGFHVLAPNSLDRSNRLAGFSGNQAIGSLSVAGTVDVVNVVYVWTLSGSGTLRIESGARFYYVNTTNWTGTVTGSGLFQQVPVVLGGLESEIDASIRLSWPSGAGLTFNVGWAGDLMSTNGFLSITNVLGSGTNDSWTDVGGTGRPQPGLSTQRFYRLQAWP